MKVKKLNENFDIVEEIETSETTEEETEVIEECKDLTEQAVKDYREFANIDESFEITAESIDDWALNEAAVKNNIQSYDLKHVLLGEEITIDQAARQLEADTVYAENSNQITDALDRSLELALDKQEDPDDDSDYPNILLVSEPGFGKTSIVKQWAKANNINLVYKDAKTMDAGALGGILARDAGDSRYANRLGTKEFDSLNTKNSVLFLDELNRAKSEIRGALLTLVQDHVIWDPTAPGEMRHLDNFLFTVAAINPSTAYNKGAKELEPAELSRFVTMNLQPDPMEHLKYLRSFYNKKIESAANDKKKLEARGRLALAEKILSSPRFTYDSAIDMENAQDDVTPKFLNYRSFKLALDRSNGTKDSLLSIWNLVCNPKKKRIIEDILGDYVDIEDKANDALKDDSQSSVFKSEMDSRAKLKQAFPELNL
jgi:hypothetical protein